MSNDIGRGLTTPIFHSTSGTTQSPDPMDNFAVGLTKAQAIAYMQSVINTLRAQGYFHQIGREDDLMAIYGDNRNVLCMIVASGGLYEGQYHIRGRMSFQSEFQDQLPYI